MDWGLLIHLDFLYYFQCSHELRASNLHSLFNEFYLTVLSIIFFVRGTERVWVINCLMKTHGLSTCCRNATDLNFLD